ncbi:adenylyl-sulfate kinase [Pedobacter hiemivivus]|uniref:Adenylyl-sulfate kinase n=1 Tax=Pedobacter hiemivivus TaxID=2530454 RepID=A0A4R0MUM7_9SPHI|nr:adenylyl-sulfate kinase [Pedobacter hiemivivus]TCC89604.1 adenylyl-sulfate kinase [Pedobacter hiemivivus]
MGVIVQFCGLSGSGKTTLANAVFHQFEKEGLKVMVLDGDHYRLTLCKDLGFSKADRLENVRRIAAEAEKLRSQYDVLILSIINPFEIGRNHIRLTHQAEVVWIKCELETLIKRDTKGLYYKAMLPDKHLEKIYNLTGVNDTFDAPDKAALVIETTRSSPKVCLDQLTFFLKQCIRQPR